MPFALIIVGLLLLVSGVRGTNGDLASLVKGDLSGDNNFIYWIVSILIIGSIGYIKDFEKLSRAFLVLVIVVLFLKKGDPNGVGGGFFSKFTSALTSTETNTSSIGIKL